jgi:hypothetical protein
VKSARFLKDGRPAVIQQAATGVTVQLPEAARDPLDTVVVLELDARP